MKKIKLTNVKVDMLKPFFDEIDIKSSQTITFTGSEINTKAYPKSKNYIKHKTINTEEIFTGGDKIGDTKLLLPLNSLDSIEKVLKFYSDGDISMTLHIDEQYIAKIEFDNGVHKFIAKSSDVEHVAPVLADHVWSEFKSVDDSSVKATLTLERIKQIIKLHEISGSESGSIAITNTEKGLVLSNSHNSFSDANDKWSFDIDNELVTENKLKIGESRIFDMSIMKLIKDNEVTMNIKNFSGNEDKSVINFYGNDNSMVICIAVID